MIFSRQSRPTILSICGTPIKSTASNFGRQSKPAFLRINDFSWQHNSRQHYSNPDARHAGKTAYNMPLCKVRSANTRAKKANTQRSFTFFCHGICASLTKHNALQFGRLVPHLPNCHAKRLHNAYYNQLNFEVRYLRAWRPGCCHRLVDQGRSAITDEALNVYTLMPGYLTRPGAGLLPGFKACCYGVVHYL